MTINKKLNLFSIINILFTLLFIISEYFLITNYQNLNFTVFTIISCFIIFLFTFNSIFIIFIISKLDNMNLKFNRLNEKNLSMQEFQDKIRAFKHDFANILQGMNGYITNNDLDGLKKYYSQFIEDTYDLNSLSTLSSDNINNPAIYSVLSQKYYKATSLNITVNFEIMLDLDTLNMKIYEFTRILGILMDNAIEAAKECENKTINISFLENKKKKMQILIIQNTYKNKHIDTSKIFEKGFSTKPNNTGLGLWEIRQILNKYKNLNLFTTKDNNFFTQQLEIYL